MTIERRTQDALSRGDAVGLPPGHVPLSEFRQRGTGQVTELASGITMRTTSAASPARHAPPSWNAIFDYSDPASDTFGIGSGGSQLFGVYRASDVDQAGRQAAPAERLRAEQRAMPSLGYTPQQQQYRR